MISLRVSCICLDFFLRCLCLLILCLDFRVSSHLNQHECILVHADFPIVVGVQLDKLLAALGDHLGDRAIRFGLVLGIVFHCRCLLFCSRIIRGLLHVSLLVSNLLLLREQCVLCIRQVLFQNMPHLLRLLHNGFGVLGFSLLFDCLLLCMICIFCSFMCLDFLLGCLRFCTRCRVSVFFVLLLHQLQLFFVTHVLLVLVIFLLVVICKLQFLIFILGLFFFFDEFLLLCCFLDGCVHFLDYCFCLLCTGLQLLFKCSSAFVQRAQPFVHPAGILQAFLCCLACLCCLAFLSCHLFMCCISFVLGFAGFLFLVCIFLLGMLHFGFGSIHLLFHIFHLLLGFLLLCLSIFRLCLFVVGLLLGMISLRVSCICLDFFLRCLCLLILCLDFRVSSHLNQHECILVHADFPIVVGVQLDKLLAALGDHLGDRAIRFGLVLGIVFHCRCLLFCSRIIRGLLHVSLLVSNLLLLREQCVLCIRQVLFQNMPHLLSLLHNGFGVLGFSLLFDCLLLCMICIFCSFMCLDFLLGCLRFCTRCRVSVFFVLLLHQLQLFFVTHVLLVLVIFLLVVICKLLFLIIILGLFFFFDEFLLLCCFLDGCVHFLDYCFCLLCTGLQLLFTY